MLLGVDHIGVGVTDMEKALNFYSDLGFTSVDFDYSGPLPGMDKVAGREVKEARVVHLRSGNPSSLGLGNLKLVQILDGEVPPLPDGIGWGEPGICEVCVHATNQAELYRHMVEDRGATSLMEPNDTVTTPYDIKCGLSYIADPFGGKMELIEWYGPQTDWQMDEGPHGVNHVAFGTSDIERTREYYRGLGFTGMLFDSNGKFDPMEPWYVGREAPTQHMILLTNPHGAGLEPVQHDPPSPEMRGEWGHVGPMDFGIGTTSLDDEVTSLKEQGFEFLSEVQEVSADGKTWRYVYLVEPDSNYVSLSESKF